MLYLESALVTLYALLIEPELAKQCHNIIALKVLDSYLENSGDELSFIAKCCFSCLYMVLPNSDFNDMLQISEHEVDLVSDYLENKKTFFSETNHLIRTIGNFSRNPRHQLMFVKSGIIEKLNSMLLRQTSCQKEIFDAFLHMIPVSNVATIDPSLPLCASDVQFMDATLCDAIEFSDNLTCKGISILLRPLDSQKQGPEIFMIFVLKIS